jgi:hypothetical protein
LKNDASHPRRPKRRRSSEDTAILRSLEPEAARDFDALLQRQARDDAKANEMAAPPNAGELLSRRVAEFAYGAGGGRKRRTLAA